MRLGFTEEASAFMSWVGDRISECSSKEPLQIMYGIDGRHKLTEEVLDHLEGYMKSGPVRIGNGAYDQLHPGIYSEQIGIHGESLGNTPQAFTHLALISAAFNLDRTLG